MFLSTSNYLSEQDSGVCRRAAMCYEHCHMNGLPGRVDVHIPSLQQVGGFSITSDPNSFHEERTFGLAIQFSEDTAAHWMHTQVLVWVELIG